MRKFISFIFILIVTLSSCFRDESLTDAESQFVDTSISTERIAEFNKYAVIDNFIKQYNTVSEVPISDSVEIDIHLPEYYKTEFRLNEFNDAIAKRGSIGGVHIDIVNYGKSIVSENDSIRIYYYIDSIDKAKEFFNNAVCVLDKSLTDEDIIEMDEALEEHDNGNYFNKVSFYYNPSYKQLFLDCTDITLLNE